MTTEKLKLQWRKASKKYKETNSKYKDVVKRVEEKRKLSTKRKEWKRNYLSSIKGRAYILRRGAISRSRKNNYEFDLTLDWIYSRLDTGICEVTGIPFKLITEKTYGNYNNTQPFSPSIDRIDNSKGYTMDNCRIVVSILNHCKMHWTDADVDIFVKAYYERNLSVGTM